MISALKRWFRSSVDIRREEYRLVGLMSVYGFLAITSYYVIKPARNSIFVDRVGAEHLPWVYIATALVLVVVMVGYSKYVDRVSRMTLLFSSMAALGASLVGFWWVLSNNSGFVSSGAFYVFTKLYPLFLVSQFWLVGNLLFTTTQARRLFGPIGVGLILGGIAGSSISGFAAERLGTEPLLLVAVGILAACAGVVGVLASRIRAGGGEASGRLTDEISGSAVKLLRGSSHLKTIAVVLLLTVVVGTLLDWQLNRAVEIFVEGEDAKTEFFGRFYAALNVASVAVQVALTGYVLRRFGVGLAILILPVALGLASAAILLFPFLYVVAVGKGAEGALRYSLDQSTRELLFLPVPTDVKYKVKPLIDLTVYRAGTGFGGVLLLVFVNGFDLPLRWISIVTLVAIAGWLTAALRMRREFSNSLRRLIGVRDVRLEELVLGRLGAEALSEIESALRGGDEHQVLYALALLEHAPSPDLVEPVANLLGHDSADVRARAVELLTDLEADSVSESVRKLLLDDALAVRVEAIRFLCGVGEDDPAEVIAGLLEDEAPEVRLGAVGCLIRHGGAEQRESGMREVRALAEHDDPEHRRAAAELLGQLGDVPEDGADLLRALVRDSDEGVCHQAMRAVGRARLTDLVPELLDRLEDPAYRPDANQALAAFGPGIHDDLLDFLTDTERTLHGRAQIPDLLVPDAEQKDLERLWEALPSLHRELRYHGLKAVNKLHRDRAGLDFEGLDPEPLVRLEMQEAAERWMAAYRAEKADAAPILQRLLAQRCREAAERAVRAIAVQVDQSDVYTAFTAMTSSRDVDRQRGFELLDTLIPQRYRPLFNPLMNPDSEPRSRAAAVRDTFDLDDREWADEAQRLAGQDDDAWLAAFATRPDRGTDGSKSPSSQRLEAVLRDEVRWEEFVELPDEIGDLMDVFERGEVLAEAKIFRSLRIEDVAAIAALTEEERFAAGEVIFDEGAPGDSLYVVVEGRVCAWKNGRVLFAAGRGRSVGSLSLLDGLPTDYQAKAEEDTRALRLDREPFKRLLTTRGAAVISVVEYLTGVVRGLNEAPDAEDGGAEEAA